MCVYCYCGDHAFRFNPPWRPNPYNPWDERIPQPITPVSTPPWNLERLKDYRDLLKEIRNLETQVGCECIDPNKPDYISLFEARIKQLQDRKQDSSSQ